MRAKVAAITGSTGKTTTKELLIRSCSRVRPTVVVSETQQPYHLPLTHMGFAIAKKPMAIVDGGANCTVKLQDFAPP